MKCQVDEIVSW